MSTTVLVAPVAAPADNAILRRRRRELIGGVLLLAPLAALPFLVRDVYTQNLVITTILFAGLSQAWNVLGGYCGQISPGALAVYGHRGLCLDAAVREFGRAAGDRHGGGCRCWAGLAALLVGWPCFRLSGHYYAIATVVVGEIGYLLFLNWDWVGAATGVYLPFKGRIAWLILPVPHQQAAVPLSWRWPTRR